MEICSSYSSILLSVIFASDLEEMLTQNAPIDQFESLLNREPWLVELRGSSPSFFNNNATLLHLAAWYNRDDIVKLLLDRKIDVCVRDGDGRSAYHDAAYKNSFESLRMLLQFDPTHVNDRSNYDWTPIMLAADHGHVECVKLLLECQADVDIENGGGQRTIDFARKGNHTDIINLLNDYLRHK